MVVAFCFGKWGSNLKGKDLGFVSQFMEFQHSSERDGTGKFL